MNAENKSVLRSTLEKIEEDIKFSWLKDLDKTKEMTNLSSILHQILEQNSIEDYFKESPNDFEYFQQQFTREVLQNILRQNLVPGPNGDQVALNLLYDYILLWKKFHRNLRYAPLWEQIREIFDPMKNYFKVCNQTHYIKVSPEKNYDVNIFNQSLPKNSLAQKEYAVGDELDYLVDYKSHRLHFDSKAWVRAKIINKENNMFTIATPDEVIITGLEGNLQALPPGTATKDWEWRSNLNEGDAIDCFDRGKWFPATILGVKKDNVTGVERVNYRIGFRLYKKFCPSFEKYKKFWPCFNQMTLTDINENEFIGDRESMDETISHFSRRIQKFNTMIAKESKANQNQYPNFNNINDELNDDGAYYYLDDLYLYKEDNGKKNYIIGRGSNFSYYFATLLQRFANEGGYEAMIEILLNKPNAEEIYMIFYILNKTCTYLHKECIGELCNQVTQGAINYINTIDNNEMRNLKKEVMELVSKVLYQFDSARPRVNAQGGNNSGSGSGNEQSLLLAELTQTITLKMIKTSIFDKKLQGVKSLSDYIKMNETDEGKINKIIQMIIDNDIVNEIFGSNSHSQIISKATDIIEILLKKNRLSENDIKLIWTGTQKGDLEGKLTILNILSEVSNYFNPEQIQILLNNIYGQVDSDMLSNEIDLTYNLSIVSKVEKNIERCLLFFTECLFSIKTKDESKITNLINKIHSITLSYPQYLDLIISLCLTNLKEFSHSLINMKLLNKFLNEAYTLRKIKDSMEENDLLILIYLDNCKEYKKRVKEYIQVNKIQIAEGDNVNIIFDSYTHQDNIQVRLDFLTEIKNNIQLPMTISIVSFLYEFLIEDCIINKDQDQFFNYVKSFTGGRSKNESIMELYTIFKDKLCNLPSQCSKLSLSSFEMFLYIFLELNMMKNKLHYYDINSKYNITVRIKNSQELEGFDILWNIIFESSNNDIMNKGIEILHLLFSGGNNSNSNSSNTIEGSSSNYLLTKCIEVLKDEAFSDKSYKITKCLKILQILIEESEKEGTGCIKSHLALRKKNRLQIEVIMDYLHHSNETYTIKVFSNTTISEIKEIMGYKLKRDIQGMKVIYKSKEITAQGKTVYELGVNSKDEIKIVGSSFSNKADLIQVNGELNPLFEKILNEWFDIYSENDQMQRENLAAFTSSVLTNKERISADDNRINGVFRNYDKESKNYLSRSDFIRFYTDAARTKPNTVWDNLATMKIRKDLKKFDDEFELPQVSIAKLPRYQLGNDEEFLKVLFSLVNKRDIGKEVIEFLFLITTNQAYYNKILSSSKETILNGNDLELLYTFHIIKSIIEDIEADWKDISSLKYKGYDDNKEDIQIKLKWIKEFIEANFTNLIKTFSDVLNRDNLNDEMNKLLFDSLLEIVSFFFSTSLKKYACYRDVIGEMELQVLKESEKKAKETTNTNNTKANTFYNSNLTNNYGRQDQNGFVIFNNDSDTEDSTIQEPTITQSIPTVSYEMGNLILSIELQSANNLGESIILGLIQYPNIIEQLIIRLHRIFIDYNTESSIVPFESIIGICFKLLLGILVFAPDPNTFMNIINTKDELLLSIITKGIISSTNNIQNILCSTLTQYTKMAEKIPNWNFLLILFRDYMTIFNNLQQKESNDKDIKSTNLNFFFDFFSVLFEIIFKIPSAELKEKLIENNIDLEKFILGITKIVHDDLTINAKGDNTSLEQQDNSNNTTSKPKLSNYLLLGYLKIIAKAVSNSLQIKQQIVSQYNMSSLLLNTILFSQNSSSNANANTNTNSIGIITTINSDNNSTNTTVQPSEKEENTFIPIDSAILADTSHCKNKQIREICYKLILALTQNNKDCIDVFLAITKLSEKEEEEEEKKNMQKVFTLQNQHYSNISKRRKKEGHVGLKNLGCICYMNSILQQMFMVPTFRYALLQSDDCKLIKNEKGYFDDNVLHQLQRMYTFLTLSSREDFNPKSFCNSFKDFDGHPINTVIQQDSQEFLNAFCDKIENCLKNSISKYIINDVFVGRTCSQVICEACGTVSNRFEDFYNLTVEVANMNTLKDSLSNLIEPEIIDGFNCETCQKKVRIKKRTSISDLPNVLIIHLKRFFMNYETEHTEKINTKLEFPNELNIKQFCIEELMHIQNPNYETDEIYYKKDEYYEYNLVGVNIHLGSADGGHYFSLINTVRSGANSISEFDPKNQSNTRSWLKFNDSSISKFNIKQMNDECFGGSNAENSRYHSFDNTQSAYLLVYERKHKTPIRVIVPEPKDKMHGIISFKDEDKARIKKEYNISNKKITEEANQLVYSSVFYDSQRNEYYKYIPFYSITKKAPLKYYREVTEDNIKQQTNEDNDYKQFYNSAFSQLESSLNLNISEYDDQIKLKLCQIFIFYIFKVTKKKSNSNKNNNNTDFSNANINKANTAITSSTSTTTTGSLSISSIIAKLDSFIKESKECLIYCSEYLSKDNNLCEILLSDDLPQTIQVVSFIQQMLILNYNNNEPLDNFWALVSTVLSIFNQLGRNLSTINYPVFDLLDYIIELSDAIVKKCFTERFFIELVNFLQMSINYNDFYQSNNNSSDSECNVKVVRIIYKLFKRSTEFNLNNYIDDSRKTSKDKQNYYLNEQLRSFESNSLLKYIYTTHPEFFIDIMIVLQAGNRNYSILTSIELCNYIDEIFATRNEKEINKLLDTLIQLLSINDEYQIDRMTVLIGHPVLIFKESDKETKWPLFGYHLLKDEKSKYIQYITNNHMIANSCILGKLTQKDDKGMIGFTRINLLVTFLEGCVRNKGMFKYVYLMPSESLQYYNFIQQTQAEIDEYIQLVFFRGDESGVKLKMRVKPLYEKIEAMGIDLDNNSTGKAKEQGIGQGESQSMSEGQDDNLEEPKSSDDFYDEITPSYLLNSFQGFKNDYIPKDIVREEISHLCEGIRQQLIKFEYFTTYIKLPKTPTQSTPQKQTDEPNQIIIEDSNKTKEKGIGIDFSQSNQFKEKSESKTKTTTDYSQNKIEDDDDNNCEDPENEVTQYIGNERVLTIPYSARKANEKEFIEKLLTRFPRLKKIIVKSSNTEQEEKEPVVSSVIRYVLYNENFHEVKAMINVKKSNNKKYNQIKSNDFVPETITEAVRGKNYSNILMIHKFKCEKDYHDSKGISFEANIN